MDLFFDISSLNIHIRMVRTNINYVKRFFYFLPVRYGQVSFRPIFLSAILCFVSPIFL